MSSETIGHFNADLIAEFAAQRDRVALLEQKLERAEQNVLYYKERCELLQRDLYGKKSEKRKLDEGKFSLLLPGFDDEERPAPPVEDDDKETITYERSKPGKKGQRLDRSSRFPESLRRVKKTLEPEDKTCSGCGAEMTHVLRTEVTEKLCCSRDPFYVQEYHRPVYACRCCSEVAPAAEVPEVLERTGVDHSVVSYIEVNKFRYGIPVFRQGQMFRDLGLKYSNDALINWQLRGLDLLQPIYRTLLETILSSRYVVADDTKFRAAVGKVVEKLPGYKQGCLWGLYALEHDIVGYAFSNSRTHAACREVLGGYEGYLIVDGYDGFERLDEKVTLVHCNNHARRGFVRAEGSDRKRAHEALLFYRALYKIEDEALELSPVERQEYRQAKATSVLEKFKDWLVLVNQNAPPKSPLGKACRYVLKRWETLTAYIGDGMLPIDTMAVERQFRMVAVGRKNYLHAASEAGAHGAAIGYTLVNTCLLQDIDPYIYLCDVLERVGSCSQHEVHQLMPQNWKKLYLEEALQRYQNPFANQESLASAADTDSV